MARGPERVQIDLVGSQSQIFPGESARPGRRNTRDTESSDRIIGNNHRVDWLEANIYEEVNEFWFSRSFDVHGYAQSGSIPIIHANFGISGAPTNLINVRFFNVAITGIIYVTDALVEFHNCVLKMLSCNRVIINEWKHMNWVTSCMDVKYTTQQ